MRPSKVPTDFSICFLLAFAKILVDSEILPRRKYIFRRQMLKTVAYRIFWRKLSTKSKKNPTEVWSTNYTSFVKFQIYFKIKPKEIDLPFGLGLPVPLICLGVYAQQKVLAHLSRKIKASYTK
jgi:hypothetical protein